MQLTSEIWVKAYLRQLSGQSIAAAVVKRGDASAGAVFIKVATLDGRAALLGPAPSGLVTSDGERRWCVLMAGEKTAERDVDNRLTRERSFDPDVWVLEVEDRYGRHCLGDWLLEE
jgi:hypothetical protein